MELRLKEGLCLGEGWWSQQPLGKRRAWHLDGDKPMSPLTGRQRPQNESEHRG